MSAASTAHPFSEVDLRLHPDLVPPFGVVVRREVEVVRLELQVVALRVPAQPPPSSRAAWSDGEVPAKGKISDQRAASSKLRVKR